MVSEDKLVYFHDYCDKCKHTKLPETDDPCYECLANPVNANSHKPMYFEEKV